MLPVERGVELTRKLDALKGKKSLSWAFLPSHENDFINYFPFGLNDELKVASAANGFIYVEDYTNADVIILTAHGSDLSKFIWNLKIKKPDAIFAVWFWDNHLAHVDNMHTALSADIFAPSHMYAADYLVNPMSTMLTFLPACSGQWTKLEAIRLSNEYSHAKRSNQLLVNYVDYPDYWRSDVLKMLQKNCRQADVFLMPPDNRNRYFSKTKANQFKEWTTYKTTLILPVHKDVSTRIFDALLAGQILIVPEIIEDFDRVITPADQEKLGIIRLVNFDLKNIVLAINAAVRKFDDMGADGVKSRFEFILHGHMLSDRLLQLIKLIFGFHAEHLNINFNIQNLKHAGLCISK